MYAHGNSNNWEIAYNKLGDKMNEQKIKYILWCPICNKRALAPFPPIAVGIDLEALKIKVFKRLYMNKFALNVFTTKTLKTYIILSPFFKNLIPT